MNRRLLIGSLIGGAVCLALLGTAGTTAAQPRTQVEFWHGLTNPLGGLIEQIVADFNASQSQYQVKPTFKGSYPETMVAAIAAFRAGNAPHIVQMFEVGTATMMSARGAIKPVHELMQRDGRGLRPECLPARRARLLQPARRPYDVHAVQQLDGHHVLQQGRLQEGRARSHQASTDLAGADRGRAKKIKATNAAPCGFTTAWPTWTQFEQFSAIHDVPLATRANGMAGSDAELNINSPLHVKHVQTLMDMQKEGTFKYGGRDAAGDALFPSGECAIIHASSGLRARILREAKFEWGAAHAALLAWHARGAQELHHRRGRFWVMTAPSRKPEEYKAVAEFFRYISQPEVVAKWHTDTGFLPITFGRVRARQGLRLLPARIRARISRISSSPGPSPPRTRAACASATCRRSGTSSRKSSRRPSRASRPPSRRSTTPYSAATSSCATSNGPTAELCSLPR